MCVCVFLCLYVFVCLYKTPSHQDDRIVGYVQQKKKIIRTVKEGQSYMILLLKSSFTPYFFFYCHGYNHVRVLRNMNIISAVTRK